MKPSYIIYAFIAIAFLFLVSGFFSGGENNPMSDLIAQAKAGNVQRIEVKGQSVSVFNNKLQRIPNYTVRIGKDTDITKLLLDEGVEIGPPTGMEIEVKSTSSLLGFMLGFLPFVIFILIFLFIVGRMQGGGVGGGGLTRFQQSGAKTVAPKAPSVTFSDVAGVDEAKEELEEIVNFLRHPEHFLAVGARIPKGVLLIGEPGTGKTLMARAVAGEAQVPFFHMSGSGFVEMFVGVGARRVRDLFEQAKRNAPSIVFIDEIDAVGRRRGSGLGGGHDEREQTLNQILVEMDGFDNNTNVIVIAATNRPDILDPALTRPGRFDRRATLHLPDMKGREAILKVHAAGKPLAPGIEYENLAKETPGASGADLANIINEAAILAGKNKKKQITNAHLEDAIAKVTMGPERKSRVINKKEKELAAYHEAGHAVVAWALEHADPVHKISIVPRGGSGGHTSMLPQEDRGLWTDNQFNHRMAVAMGGRVAELTKFDQLTTGASSDLEHATRIARAMVKKYGMSDLGPRAYGEKHESLFANPSGSEGQDHSDKTDEKIDEEIDKLLAGAYNLAKETIEENEEEFKALAEYLIKYENVSGEEMEDIFKNPDYKPVPRESNDETEGVLDPLGGITDIAEKEEGGGSLPDPAV